MVGATGQLGTFIIDKLIQCGMVVHALVRVGSSYAHLENVGIGFFTGDLPDPESLKQACSGATHLIATANTAAPTRKGDTFKAVDADGYRKLIDAASAAGIGHFVYCSVKISGKFDGSIPLSRAKRVTEDYLMKSVIPCTIFRPDAYMDVYFAFLGSDLPARGEQNASLNRPFIFMQNF